MMIVALIVAGCTVSKEGKFVSGKVVSPTLFSERLTRFYPRNPPMVGRV